MPCIEGTRLLNLVNPGKLLNYVYFGLSLILKKTRQVWQQLSKTLLPAPPGFTRDDIRSCCAAFFTFHFKFGWNYADVPLLSAICHLPAKNMSSALSSIDHDSSNLQK